MPQGRRGARSAGRQGPIDWMRTLQAGRPSRIEDVQLRPRRQRAEELWLVIVDASASTHRHHALSDAKGVLAQSFDDAYRQRTRLALLSLSGGVAHWQVQGMKASNGLRGWLDALGAGGGTPLLAALEQAQAWLSQRRKRFASEQQRLLLLTDGRLKSWARLPLLDCPGVLIDMERGPICLGRARQLASGLGLEYRHLDELPLVGQR